MALATAAGVVAHGEGAAYANAVEDLVARPGSLRRQAARARAERFGWPTAVDGFLHAHGAAPSHAGISATSVVRASELDEQLYLKPNTALSTLSVSRSSR